MKRLIFVTFVVLSHILMGQSYLLEYQKILTGDVKDTIHIQYFISDSIICIEDNNSKRPYVSSYFIEEDKLLNYFLKDSVYFVNTNFSKTINTNTRKYDYKKQAPIKHLGLTCYNAYEYETRNNMDCRNEIWYTKDLPYKEVNLLSERPNFKGLPIIVKTYGFEMKLISIDTTNQFIFNKNGFMSFKEYLIKLGLDYFAYVDFKSLLKELNGRDIDSLTGIEFSRVILKTTKAIPVEDL